MPLERSLCENFELKWDSRQSLFTKCQKIEADAMTKSDMFVVYCACHVHDCILFGRGTKCMSSDCFTSVAGSHAKSETTIFLGNRHQHKNNSNIRSNNKRNSENMIIKELGSGGGREHPPAASAVSVVSCVTADGATVPLTASVQSSTLTHFAQGAGSEGTTLPRRIEKRFRIIWTR